MPPNTRLLAQVYGACSYGDNNYQTGANCTPGSTPGTTTPGGGAPATGASGSLLTNTGFDALLIGSLAAAIICIALIIRFWKRPKRAPTPPLPNAASPQQGAAVAGVDQPEQHEAGGHQQQQ